MKEIIVDDIPEKGFSIRADEGDKWFLNTLSEALGDSYDGASKAFAMMDIVRYEQNVTIDGKLGFRFAGLCDRCLEDFSKDRNLNLHVILVPSSTFSSENEGEDIEKFEDDLEFFTYEGDRFDLAEVIREQILLSKPMKELCSDGCKGLCQRCGKNLNEGSCQCKDEVGDPRFAPLKAFGKSDKKN